MAREFGWRAGQLFGTSIYKIGQKLYLYLVK